MKVVKGRGIPEQNLDEFLHEASLSRDQLLDQYDSALGEATHVAVGGSVPAGYGNPLSDLDLHAITPSSVVFNHSVSHETPLMVDVVAHARPDILSAIASLGSWAGRDLSLTPEPEAKQRDVTLWTLARLSLSVPLRLDQDIQEAIEAAGPDLVDAAVTYWTERACRQMYLADLLVATHWPQALACGVDALLAAVKAEAAGDGFVYQERKFLGLDLEQIGNEALLSHYRRALAAPVTRSDVGPWLDGAGEAVRAVLGGERQGSVGLTWAPGVQIRALRQNESIVTLWDLHGALVKGDLPPVGEIVWRGSLADQPPRAWSELLGRGLLGAEVVLDA